MARAARIGLGTTNSVVAATIEGGQAEVVPNAEVLNGRKRRLLGYALAQPRSARLRHLLVVAR